MCFFRCATINNAKMGTRCLHPSMRLCASINIALCCFVRAIVCARARFCYHYFITKFSLAFIQFQRQKSKETMRIFLACLLVWHRLPSKMNRFKRMVPHFTCRICQFSKLSLPTKRYTYWIQFFFFFFLNFVDQEQQSAGFTWNVHCMYTTLNPFRMDYFKKTRKSNALNRIESEMICKCTWVLTTHIYISIWCMKEWDNNDWYWEHHAHAFTLEIVQSFQGKSMQIHFEAKRKTSRKEHWKKKDSFSVSILAIFRWAVSVISHSFGVWQRFRK